MRLSSHLRMGRRLFKSICLCVPIFGEIVRERDTLRVNINASNLERDRLLENLRALQMEIDALRGKSILEITDSSSDQTDEYQMKLNQELTNFNDDLDVHALPSIFYYWSNKHLKPIIN